MFSWLIGGTGIVLIINMLLVYTLWMFMTGTALSKFLGVNNTWFKLAFFLWIGGLVLIVIAIGYLVFYKTLVPAVLIFVLLIMSIGGHMYAIYFISVMAARLASGKSYKQKAFRYFDLFWLLGPVIPMFVLQPDIYRLMKSKA